MPGSRKRGSRGSNPATVRTCSWPITPAFDKNLRIDGFSSGFGPFGLGPDRYGSATVQPVLVGALVVDITDARTRALVWRGMASGDIKPSDKPEQRDKKLAKATEKMFKNYPPKS